MQSVNTPYQIFHDIEGDQLNYGYIYVGESGKNAETNPVNTFWDAELTIPAPQPIRTLNGFPSYNGSRGVIYVAEADYSVLTKNKNGTQIDSVLSQKERIDATAIDGNVGTFDTISDLVASGAGSTDGVIVIVSDYHSDTSGGGGTFKWDAAGSKAEHNGGTVIDPDITYPTDWTNQVQLTAWFTAGVGTGVWKKLDGGYAVGASIDVKCFGAKDDGATNNSKSIQQATDSCPHVTIFGDTFNADDMIEVKTSKVIELLGSTTVKKSAASTDDNPVFWLKNNGATLIGAGQLASKIKTEKKSPHGVVRVGHKDMTESHTNMSYCTLSGLSISGSTSYGQTTGEPDSVVYMANPQLGGIVSYFHNINNLRIADANYGMRLDGWANANTIYGIQGYRLGNTASGHNAMFWINGALDNTVSASFFHGAPDSIMLKLTNLDNTVNGGSVHTMFANTFYGLVAEQGGASAQGVWTNVAGGSSYIEMRHNVGGGNTFPAGWSKENKFVGLGGEKTFPAMKVEQNDTDETYVQIKEDGRLLVGLDAITDDDENANASLSGTTKIGDRSSTRSYSGTGSLTITVKHGYNLSGASYRSAAVEILYSGVQNDGINNIASKYLIPISGISTWDLGTPVNLGGGTLTITEVSASNNETVFTVTGSSTSNCSIIATATGRQTAILA